MLSESKLATRLSSLELHFISGNSRKMELDSNKILIYHAVIILLPDKSSRSLQFIYCMTKASFVTTIQKLIGYQLFLLIFTK